jgi:hypothetical protein
LELAGLRAGHPLIATNSSPEPDSTPRPRGCDSSGRSAMAQERTSRLCGPGPSPGAAPSRRRHDFQSCALPTELPRRGADASDSHAARRRPGGSLRVGVPAPQRRQGVDGSPAGEPGPLPDLEMQVGAERVAGVSDVPDALAGTHGLAPADADRALAQVVEDVVAVGPRAVDHDVVAGAGAVGSSPRHARID